MNNVPERRPNEDEPLDPETAASLAEIVRLLEEGLGRPRTREEAETWARLEPIVGKLPGGPIYGSGG